MNKSSRWFPPGDSKMAAANSFNFSEASAVNTLWHIYPPSEWEEIPLKNIYFLDLIMVSLHCQLNWVWNHPGDMRLGESVSFLGCLTSEGKLTLNVRAIIPQAWVSTPGWIKQKEEVNRALPCTFLPLLTGCLALLTLLSCLDFPTMIDHAPNCEPKFIIP